jgi:hypothetical protein
MGMKLISNKNTSGPIPVKRRIIKALIGGAIGAAAGFLYYYFVGCRSGTCAITSNPYFSVLYGLIAGIVIGGL